VPDRLDRMPVFGIPAGRGIVQIEALGLELIEVRRESPSSVTPPHPEAGQAERS